MTMEQAFKIRPYSKRELAQLYFPYLENPASAVSRLRMTMTYCRPLMQRLAETGYVDRSQYFTARQVRLIVEYLGDP